jgi:hypothetical protein
MQIEYTVGLGIIWMGWWWSWWKRKMGRVRIARSYQRIRA